MSNFEKKNKVRFIISTTHCFYLKWSFVRACWQRRQTTFVQTFNSRSRSHSGVNAKVESIIDKHSCVFRCRRLRAGCNTKRADD